MGLPEINIVFQSLATTAIERSQRGTVVLIVKDDTATERTYTFTKISEVDKTKFTSKIYDYIELAFKGSPNKLIVEVMNTTNERTLQLVLKDLKNKKFNYMAIPGIEKSETTEVTTWIKECRKDGKVFKAVLPNTAADYEGIINFATTGIKVGDKAYTTEEYCARIAGILAGLPVTRSSTYYVLDEVDEIVEHDDPNTDIDAGKLILVNDGVKIKIGRGVNSLTTVEQPKSKEFKKIKILESMDIMYEDIKTTFEDEYIGKVTNSYDNKIIFLSAVNAYFRGLQKDGVLEPNSEALAELDLIAQEKYLTENQVDITELSEQELKEANTGSKVFFKASVTPLDAMEDLDFNIYI
ncbi:phage tail sheath C-terminal domain-containing protein [Terrisporobacter hibernicus]|uniref:Phage tail sheath subtilisin-like domain-containing protein n=1 Tax=Terrisporobacter hibernicus TaxID=2813371 RepID=A0AAX2ZG67_9FIRM|nr:phage tail sheath C-terminal domain-containing protein [Terrisporobacter hibernicus]UEL47355.1 phage tail sheath subtilisin-like domain-containing protein [Terrisporobacter hibernicus]